MTIFRGVWLYAALLLLAACQTTSKTVQLNTPSGYSTNSAVYSPAEGKPAKSLVFIVIHGKSGAPDRPHLMNLYPKLTDAGYEVIAPKMPWTRDWSGTLEDGMKVLDAAIIQAADQDKQVVLIGHSLGGAAVLIYASHPLPKSVIGIVTVAPGHMPHHSNRLQDVTATSVAKARKMVAAGNGDEKASFKELNNGKVRERTMSARAYLSYYDLQQFPDVETLLPKIKLPVLWVAGSDDRLTQIYDMETLFADLPANPKSSYKEIAGNHKSVLANSAPDILYWVQQL